MRVLKESITRFGKSEIINSDQGSQVASALRTEYLESAQIQITMDGKGRATDNIFIERLWRAVKQGYVDLHPLLREVKLFKGLEPS